MYSVVDTVREGLILSIQYNTMPVQTKTSMVNLLSN